MGLVQCLKIQLTKICTSIERRVSQSRDLLSIGGRIGQVCNPLNFREFKLTFVVSFLLVFAVMSSTDIPDSVDVLVVGGGPTGLLISYILLRSDLKVLTVGEGGPRFLA